MVRQILDVVALTTVAALSCSVAARAQGGLDDEPQNCLRAESIRSTAVIDDQTIVFYMPRNRIFRNDLPENCPHLAEAGRFMYERRVGQRVGRLCSVDSITVIDTSLVPPYGATCGLGMFHPIEAADILEMSNGSSVLVQTVEIELPEEAEPENSAATIEGESPAGDAPENE